MTETSNHQLVMDKAYDKWQKNESWDYDQFYASLDTVQKIAVLTGNFNYHVENGGFYQWHDNGYSSKAQELLTILATWTKYYPVVKQVYDLILKAVDIIESYEELIKDAENGTGGYDWDEDEDYDSGAEVEIIERDMRNQLDTISDQYYKINEKFMSIMEDIITAAKEVL